MKLRQRQLWHAWLLGFLLAVQGCAWGKQVGWDGVEIDTPRKGLIQLDAELAGQYLLVEDLIESDKISAENADKALNYLDQGRRYIRAAWVEVKTNGGELGETLVSKVQGVLGYVTAILGSHSSNEGL